MAKKKPLAAKKAAPKKGTSKKGPAKASATRKGSANQSKSPRSYWLVKSEPYVFSIDDLANAPGQTTCWDGVRNYQARNTLRDDMKKGDLVLYYHSNAEPPGIAGIAKVVREGYPDHTAFDPNDKHYDPKSKKSEPRWFMVDIKLVQKFKHELPLPDLKANKKLEGMVLLQKGSRLSVQPVSEQHFQEVERLGKKS